MTGETTMAIISAFALAMPIYYLADYNELMKAVSSMSATMQMTTPQTA